MKKTIIGEALKKSNDFYHKGCRGKGLFSGIMIDGRGKVETIADVLFINNSIVTFKYVQPVVYGACLSCGKEGAFTYGNRTLKKFNKRLQKVSVK